MLEAARIIGGFSAALLIAAIAAWVKVFRGPKLRRLDGGTAPDVAKGEIASQLLALSVGLSAVAAILAIASWITA